MDDLTLIRSFRAERAADDPTARAAIGAALGVHIAAAANGGAAASSASPIPAAVPVDLPAASGPRRRRLPLFRRRLFVLAGATALAAVVAGVVVLNAGPTAEPAAAEVLRQTAVVAAHSKAPSGIPGPGEFLYAKVETRDLTEWVPGEYTASYGGLLPVNSEAFNAFVPTIQESWRSAKEPSRNRWTLGALQFFPPSEKDRWEAAGSPLPAPFGGRSEAKGFPGAKVLQAKRGTMDVENLEGSGFRDYRDLPTDPKALRLAIERRQSAGSRGPEATATGSLDVPRTIAELWDILDKATTTPPLRAAVFGALSELPGIELDREAKDLVGRPGYALSYEKPATSTSEWQIAGVRTEYIFDPDTSAVLGKREVVVDTNQTPWGEKQPPNGTVFRETAYLASGFTDSTHERPR